MHFASMRQYIVVLIIAAVVALAVTAYLSLPRAYLLMATTTSTRDTGLLPPMLRNFTLDTGIEVRYIAVGTGQALDAGRRGGGDDGMVHAPALEGEFIGAKCGPWPQQILYRTLVIVWPAG